MIIKSLFVRTSEELFKSHKGELILIGYDEGIEVFKVSRKIAPNFWFTVHPTQVQIDSILLPKGFHFDDMNIIHDSDFDENSNGRENPQLANLLQSVIDEIVEKKVDLEE